MNNNICNMIYTICYFLKTDLVATNVTQTHIHMCTHTPLKHIILS